MLKVYGGTEFRSSPRRLEKLSVNTDKHQKPHETRLFLILTTLSKKEKDLIFLINQGDMVGKWSRYTN